MFSIIKGEKKNNSKSYQIYDLYFNSFISSVLISALWSKALDTDIFEKLLRDSNSSEEMPQWLFL